MTDANAAGILAWLTGLTRCQWAEDTGSDGYRCEHGYLLTAEFVAAAYERYLAEGEQPTEQTA